MTALSKKLISNQILLSTRQEGSEAELSIEPKVDANKQINAYLGAVAEHLSIRYYLDTPGWANDYSRFLDEEFFPCQLESSKIRDLLRRESPSAFRRRMIYVDKDPLYRPRRQLT